MFGDNREFARRRYGAGVHAIIGANGDGKSLCAAHDLRFLLEERTPVLSSCRLLDYTNPRPCDDPGCVFPEHDPAHPENDRHKAAHPLWVPLMSYEQLMDWRDGAVFLDEVTGWADARDSSGLPSQARTFLRKLRHYDIPLIWTAPDWMAADAILRRVSRVVTVSKGHAGKKHVKPCRECGERHEKPVKAGCQARSMVRLWPDNRLFRWKTYDATAFEAWSMAKVDSTAPQAKARRAMVAQTYRRGPNMAQHAYDTYAEVLSVSTADHAGVCVSCNGTRTRPRCSCPDYVERVTAAKATSGSGRRGRGPLGAPEGSPGGAPADLGHGPSRRSRHAAPEPWPGVSPATAHDLDGYYADLVQQMPRD